MRRFSFGLLIAFLLLLLISTSASAEDAENDIFDAITKTQETLKNAGSRNEAATTPDAKSAKTAMDALGGTPENTEALYGLSADVFSELAKQSGGNPDKMTSILENAKKNPEGFANQLSPAVRAKIREIAAKIPGGQIP